MASAETRPSSALRPGFVTVGPDLKFRVSDALDEDYANGREYYAMAGREIAVPHSTEKQPDRDLLTWHAETVFRT